MLRSILQTQTGVYSFTVTDELDAHLPVGSITAFTITYYDRETKQILNSRQDQNALNLNGVAVATSGCVTTATWTLTPLDTIIYDSRRETEYHIALFQWTWSLGAKSKAREVQIPIEQVTYV